jgi:hypothetical protein
MARRWKPNEPQLLLPLRVRDTAQHCCGCKTPEKLRLPTSPVDREGPRLPPRPQGLKGVGFFSGGWHRGRDARVPSAARAKNASVSLARRQKSPARQRREQARPQKTYPSKGAKWGRATATQRAVSTVPPCGGAYAPHRAELRLPADAALPHACAGAYGSQLGASRGRCAGGRVRAEAGVSVSRRRCSACGGRSGGARKHSEAVWLPRPAADRLWRPD